MRVLFRLTYDIRRRLANYVFIGALICLAGTRYAVNGQETTALHQTNAVEAHRASASDPGQPLPAWARECVIRSITPAPTGTLKTAQVELQMDAERIVTLRAGERFDDQPWVESVQPCDDGEHYKVALKSGEERAELIVGSEFVQEPPSQVEIEARFIEVNETRLRQMQLRRQTNELGKEEGALHMLASALKRQSSANLLTAPHAQELLQLLTSRSGTDVLGSPHVTTKFGQRAVIEIIREFRYAVEWARNAKPARWIPTAYETRNAGVTLEVEPETDRDGAMTLRVAPQVVNFLGWRDIDTGRRVRSGATGEYRVQPVFSARKAETTVKLVDGQTILLTQFAETENTQPFASPRSGRRLIVMMTAHLTR